MPHGRCEVGDLSRRLAEQRLRQRAFVADAALCGIGFGLADDAERLFERSARFLHHHGHAHRHLAGGRVHVLNQHAVGQIRFNFLDSNLKHGLGALGLVVPGIFPQVAMGDCLFQFLGNFHAAGPFQLRQLIFEPGLAGACHRDLGFVLHGHDVTTNIGMVRTTDAVQRSA